MDDLGRARRGQVRIGSADRDEGDVDVAELLEIRGGKRMAEIAKVADDEIVEADREHRVAPAVVALVLVMEGADAGDQDLVDFILTRPAEDHRLAADGAEARVAR